MVEEVPPYKLAHFVADLVFNANATIDLIAYKDSPMFYEHKLNDVTYEFIKSLVDNEWLRLRGVIARPRKIISNQLDSLQSSGHAEIIRDGAWEIRVPQFIPLAHTLIIDNKHALYTDFNSPLKNPPTIYFSSTLETRFLVGFFHTIWSGMPTLLFQDSFHVLKEEDVDSIIVESESYWKELIQYFALNPSELQKMDSRKFEELIAHLLKQEGMDVNLTPKSKDGGRDLLAYHKTKLGVQMYYIECKRYSLDNPVGVKLVRELYGIVEADRATAGLLITTSRFTKGALGFRESVRNRMALKGYNQLCDWIKAHYRR